MSSLMVVTAPEKLPLKIFLAGGISGCPDWQKVMTQLLSNAPVIALNPRREDFDLEDKSMTEKQIEWEHKMLEQSDIVLFWFPKETLCPITLFELGKIGAGNKEMFVGVEYGYQRLLDVVLQLRHIRPEVHVQFSIRDLAEQVLQKVK